MKKPYYTNVLRIVAKKEGTTLEEVTAEIDLAIHEALTNAKQDEVFMKRWEQIP